ncbi:amidophosphoribosyltransferase [Helicobacter pametensis]|uniref:amidophosphoribosyltransferase n=1 Tax=Helicobacter pametensis TaxID=95149 RepID=UPI000483CE9B|nr:amidophosphoribosyltransferase [Helicobacter pametensis]
MQKIKEECGVFGIFSKNDLEIGSLAYYGLSALQHRGQESCGIAISQNRNFKHYKDVGLVHEVFTPQILSQLGQGNLCVAHVRYCTTGGNNRQNAQPILVNHIKGSLAVAHNGNLVNSYELREELELQGSIFHTTSDTEVIAHIITKQRLQTQSIEEAIEKSIPLLKGAYSLLLMSPSKIIALRDPHGFRPLCYGQMQDGTYIIASESTALDAIGATFIREIRAGEIVVFSHEGVKSIETYCNQVPPKICSFEYIYFARADSIFDGKSIHQARIRAGEFLAKSHPIEADLVIGVPDSGIDAAIGYARESKIPYGVGFVKNRYIARTFISPTQEERIEKLKLKLNPILSNIQDKRIVLIDDSIVRGNTTLRLVKLLRESGVREIHMRVSAPPFMHPCFYGTDIDSQENLIACKYSLSQIKDYLGLDSLGYLSMEGLKYMLEGCAGFCHACFSGDYPTSTPSIAQKNKFEQG